MSPHIEASPMALALGEIVRPEKPTKREVKRCAKRLGRAREMLSDTRVVPIAFGRVATPKNVAAAQALLDDACRRCGWCAVFGITPRPP